MSEASDDRQCRHSDFGSRDVTVRIHGGDVNVTHVECGKPVWLDHEFLMSEDMAMTLTYSVDEGSDEAYQVLKLRRPDEQPQDERDKESSVEDGDLVPAWKHFAMDPEQPQDDGDVRIVELEREVRQLRAGAIRAWKQDWHNPISRFEAFINATLSYDSDHLGGIMRGGHAEATITLGDLRAVLARLAELEAHPWMVVDPEQNERDGDVRAVAEVAAADDDTELDRAISDLIARFADRVEALEARDAKAAARERIAELAEHAEEKR